ncbi:MAG: SRPBCC family protein [Gammaproteobacteria bacterium]
MAKSTVILPNDLEVVVVRDFRAPRATVFDAWTKPELISQWLLGPPGWTMPVCEMDLRVGGKFRWRWRSDAGAEFGFSGVFREVVQPSRLVHTQVYDPGTLGGTMGVEALITAVLTEASGITTYTTTIRYQSKSDRDAAISTGMTDGMEQSFAKLDALLAGAG